MITNILKFQNQKNNSTVKQQTYFIKNGFLAVWQKKATFFTGITAF
jgi:hypothetical protein